MAQDKDAQREIALVTGGNRGLGLETARQLARHGMPVLLTSRDPAAGEQAATTLRKEGLEVTSAPLDVTSLASIEALATDLERRDVRIAALVNNAGTSMHGFNAEVARRTIDTNFYGPLHVTDRLLSRMDRPGRIVMVSSGLGELEGLPNGLRRRFEDPGLTREALLELVESFVEAVARGDYARLGWPGSGYRVSKLSLNALTRILARELEGSGLLVNAVCPGWVRTRMGGLSAPKSVEEGADTIVRAALLPPGNPSGRFFRERAVIPW